MPAACAMRPKIRDRDTRHIIDGVDAVELERVDDEMEAVGQLLLGARCLGLRCGIQHRRLSLVVGADDGSSSWMNGYANNYAKSSWPCAST